MMWYFVKDEVQQGPVSDDQIRGMARDGSLRGEDLVWREGMASWQAAWEAGIEFPVAPAAPPPPPPQYGAPAAQYYPSPALTMGAAAAIPDYLPWSIAAAILCCQPLGIVAIVFAVRANSAKTIGDLRGAAEAANQAKIWLYLAVGIWLLVGLLYGVAIIAGMLEKM